MIIFIYLNDQLNNTNINKLILSHDPRVQSNTSDENQQLQKILENILGTILYF